eukprot:gene9852-10863_t
MADDKELFAKKIPDLDRRETKSESNAYRKSLDSEIDFCKNHVPKRSPKLRSRSYSQNDSDKYAEQQVDSSSPRRLSLTEALLGRRNTFKRQMSESLIEETSSLLNLDEGDGEEEIESKENDEELVKSSSSNSVFSNGDQYDESKNVVVVEKTQTDHLNKRLLDAFLQRINNFSLGNSGNATNMDESGKEHEPGRDSPRDYSVLYTDDFLIDHIYRKLNQKK